MIVDSRDTIAAIATPAGAGGIGIIRISGGRAGQIVGELLGRSAVPPDRQLVFGTVYAEGARIDDVLAVVMRAPRSYTGEDVGEIHGHGGAANMSRLLRAVIAAGARHAEPGEFTRRAFENGRLDLARAEAIADVINAGSDRAWRLAQEQLGGWLGAKVKELRRQLVEVLAEVEARIDFPEEDIERWGASVERCGEIGAELEGLVESYEVGRSIREGISVALVGPVNVGKSSLFNALLGRERALVSEEAGTTRDFVEADVVWQGIQVTLIDTAGERTGSVSEVEKRGQLLGRERIGQCDVQLMVRDQLAASVDQRRERIQVVAKGDLLANQPQGDAIVTSAKTGQGIEELKRAVIESAVQGEREAGEGRCISSERQRDLLKRTGESLGAGRALLISEAPLELVAVELHAGVSRLGEVLGESVEEEVLDELFARFCIGK